MGNVHAQAYSQMDEVSVIGVFDTDPLKRTVAEANGHAFFHSFEELLAAQPDVVDVCVPTDVHKKYVLQAARAKKHIICEKPIARTLEDAIEMKNVCDEEGVSLYIGQVVRFFPEYAAAKASVVRERIGNPGTSRLKRCGSYPNGHDDWYGNDARSGSVFLDVCIHDIDFMCWLYGDVERVYAKGFKNTPDGAYVHGSISLRFTSGAIAQIEGSWAYPSGFLTEFDIAGTSGILEFSSEQTKPLQTMFKETLSKEGQPRVQVPSSPTNESPYAIELRHFLDCLRGDAQPIVPTDEAIYALRIALAARKSAETNEVIEIGGHNE